MRCSTLLTVLAVATSAAAYNRAAAVAHAAKWYHTADHSCSTAYDACSPWSYWGEESCGYASHGGDCANFLSQNLLAGGHPALTKSPCRGYPCGKEEIGAANLGSCLAKNYGWRSSCGAHANPPADIAVGDALIFHGASCSDEEAHATLVVYVGGDFIGLAAHSNDVFNRSYTEYAGEFGYYDWLHYAA